MPNTPRPAISDTQTDDEAGIDWFVGPSRAGLLHPEGMESFAQCVLNSTRTIPVVMLSPMLNGTRCAIDADQLALRLGASALVVHIPVHSTTFLLTEKLGRGMTCFGGAVRIIPPMSRIMVGSWCHLLMADKLLDMAHETALNLIERHVLNHGTARRPSPLAKPDNGKGGLPRTRPAARPLPRPERTGPRTLIEAVDIASRECSYLEILDSARKSAERSPYKWPARLLDTLRAVDTVAALFQEDGVPRSGKDWRDALRARGHEYQHRIGERTGGQWGADYTYAWNGKMVMFQAHITIGRGAGADICMSVHMLPDTSTGKVVVAHAGVRKRNTLTN